MTSNPEDVVSAFFRALGEREVEKAESLLSADAGFHVPAAGPVLEAGHSFIRDLTTAFPDLQVEIRNSFTSGDKVVVELTMTGTQGEDHWGVAAQGKHFAVDQGWLIDVERGLITDARAFWCRNAVYRRLGAPSPASTREKVSAQ